MNKCPDSTLVSGCPILYKNHLVSLGLSPVDSHTHEKSTMGSIHFSIESKNFNKKPA